MPKPIKYIITRADGLATTRSRLMRRARDYKPTLNTELLVPTILLAGTAAQCTHCLAKIMLHTKIALAGGSKLKVQEIHPQRPAQKKCSGAMTV